LTYPGQTPYLPPHLAPDAVEHRLSDFSLESLKRAFAGQDVIICTIAGGDYDFQIRVVDAVVAAEVWRFIPHEFGHDSLNKHIRKRLPRQTQRARIIDYLRALSVEHPDFEWSAVATSCMLDSELIDGTLGFDLQWQTATIHGTGTDVFAVSSLARVGAMAVGLLQDWEEVKNRYIYAAGSFTSASEILSVLEAVTGTTWTTDYGAIDDCV
jgi:hypothetical protein